MKNKVLRLYILLTLFSSAGGLAFAVQSSSSTKDRPPADTADVSVEQMPAVPSDTAAADTQASYLDDINKLIENSRENIKDVNQKIKEQAILKRNEKREEKVREYYKMGEDLTKEGKLEEARDYFEKAIRITEHPEMAKYIKEKQLWLKKQGEIEAAYKEAVDLFKQKEYHPAQDAFEHVDRIAPDFEATRSYLKIIGQQISTADALAAKQQAIEVENQKKIAEAARAKEQQILLAQMKEKERQRQESLDKQAQEIEALSQKSAQLYSQIADIADDQSTMKTKLKMAQVDQILNNLKEDKQRLLRQKQEEQYKRQQEQIKTKEQERRDQAEKWYQEGQDYLRSNDYAKAKIKFLELESMVPDYKSTQRFLSRVEEGLKKANVEAVTSHEQKEAARLRQLQEMEKAEELRRAQEEQEKQHMIELQQQASLKELTDKASDINDEIINLSKEQDYEEMKVKFAELENTVNALMKLKYEMSKQKGIQEREKELSLEAAGQHNEILRSQKMEEQQIRALNSGQPPKNFHPVLSIQPSDADYYKRREIMQEQNMLFSEGVDRYEHKKYSQARLLFGELADQHDRRAEAWLKKVDHAISQQLLRSEESEARERTAFLEDQLKAQRELIIIQERERLRQKRLTEELERQKRYYEDDRLLQLRKEETMKAQERERQRQEAKRLKIEKENEKQQEMFRFHKIKAVVKAQPAAPAAAAPVSSSPVAAVGPAMAAKQPQAQNVLSNEQSGFLDKKHQKEQWEQERQAKLNEVEDAKARLAQEKAERAVQEKKHREEFMRQQEQQRDERIRQEQIIREETKRRKELERQERQRQVQLEAQRESVRKQLEDGVEGMYQDALRLYHQGEYTAAADRFKDVQDILPGYKRAGEFMFEARQKSMGGNPQAAITPEASQNSSNTSQDNVSKALDLFEPNAK